MVKTIQFRKRAPMPVPGHVATSLLSMFGRGYTHWAERAEDTADGDLRVSGSVILGSLLGRDATNADLQYLIPRTEHQTWLDEDLLRKLYRVPRPLPFGYVVDAIAFFGAACYRMKLKKDIDAKSWFMLGMREAFYTLTSKRPSKEQEDEMVYFALV